MNKFINKAGVTAIVLGITVYNALPGFVHNALASEAGKTIKAGLGKTNLVANLDETPLPALIGNLIKALLGVVGIIFLIYTVVGGIIYMTSGDDGKKVTKAKDMIKNALIGLIIIVVAYSLTSFVVETISKATAGGGADKKDGG